MADHAYSTPARAAQSRGRRAVDIHREFLERALDRLLTAAEAVVADLDALDGDADLEPTLGSGAASPFESQRRWAAGYDPLDSKRELVCEDEGAQCEGEGDPEGI